MATKTIKPTTLRTPRENKALEQDYSSRLKKLTTDISKSFYYWTIATVNKNENKNIAKQLAFNFNDLIKRWDKKTNEFAKKEALRTVGQVQTFVNSNLKSQNPEFALKRSSKSIDNSLNAVYQRNYNLIKTIPQDIKERFESVFLNNVNNFDMEAIKKQVLTIDGIGKRRAETIARDQVHKAIGEYHSAREQALGFEYYEWQTSKDERVSSGKGGHRILEGRIYRYDTPSAVIDSYGNVGDPAQRVNCRCRRRAVILKPNQDVKLVKDSLHGDYYVIIEK